MSEIKIINPPLFMPMTPDLSIASQFFFLKKLKLDVESVDFNITFHKEIYSKEYIQKSLDKIKEVVKQKSNTSFKENPDNLEEKILKFRADRIGNEEIAYAFCRNNYILENIEKVFQYMKKNKNILNPLKTSLIEKILYIARRIIFTPYQQMELHNIYRLKSDKHNIFDVFDALIDNEDLNLYLQIYKKHYNNIIDKNTKIVVITANSEHQLLSALTLSSLIKKENPNIHINISSYFFTNYPNYIKQSKDFFKKYANSVMIKANEDTIYQLVSNIEKKKPLKDLNNILIEENYKLEPKENKYKKSNTHKKHKTNPKKIKRTSTKYDFIRMQKYNKEELSNYFIEENVFTLFATYGPYWRKDKTMDYTDNHKYGNKNIKNLIEEIKELKEKYNVKYISFCDWALPPSFCKKLSDELIKQKINIYYYANLRPEKTFTYNLLKKMYKSGFRQARLSFTSLNQRIHDLYNTGINIKETERFIKDLNRIGIYCYFYLQECMPTQTKEEIEESTNFLIKNKKYIQNVDTDTFSLRKNSYLHKNLKEFGITRKNLDKKFVRTRPVRLATKEQFETLNKVRELIQKEIKQPICFQYTQNVWYCSAEIALIYCAKYGLKNLKLIDKIYKNQRIHSLRHQAEIY